MKILERVRTAFNQLPPALAWLKDGPEQTRCAVMTAKRRLLLLQAPITFGFIALFSALRSLGVVEPNGHAQVIAHLGAATAFMWPPTLFSVCLAAKRDIQRGSSPNRNMLKLLCVTSGAVATFATATLAGVTMLYAHTLFHIFRTNQLI